jgi:hypothetical protein
MQTSLVAWTQVGVPWAMSKTPTTDKLAQAARAKSAGVLDSHTKITSSTATQKIKENNRTEKRARECTSWAQQHQDPREFALG